MGLATIDPHSHKVQTKLHKILKFGVNRPDSKQDTAIWKCQNLQRNVWPPGRCVGWPYISLLILTFLNHCISVQTSLINTKLGDFVNLDVPLCGSIVANPIIYRIVPSPSRFETRQWSPQRLWLLINLQNEIYSFLKTLILSCLKSGEEK